MMRIEKLIHLKYLDCLGLTPIEALKLLQKIYGDNSMTRAQIFEWHRRFKEIKEVEKEDSRRWGQSTSRIEEKMLSV